MIFSRGSLSFRSFYVTGQDPYPDDERAIESLSHNAFDGFSGDEGRAAGWISLEHILDIEFSAEKNVRGPFLAFGLRLDQRRVPPALYKAHCAIEIKAALEVSEHDRLSGAEKREIRRRVKQQLIEEVTPASRAIGLFWHRKQRCLHVNATSRTVLAEIEELFDRSFELSLEPRDPTLLGLELARDSGLGEAFGAVDPPPLFAELSS
jgi:hypothetical protein